MTLTLLLDLDDTLLDNSMDTFLPAYLQALGEYLAPFIPPDKLIPALLTGTQSMLDNNMPDRTLKEAFDQVFYSGQEIDEKVFQEKFASFYSEIFPSLEHLTEIHTEAIHQVREAFDRNYKVAIATNPLFPRTAILQRLEWAGLPPEDFPFDYIPSYEITHFAKPNTAFFSEVLGTLGWPEGPVVMVGDDFEHDIAPARLLGIGNFWVSENRPDPKENLPASAGQGPIGDLVSWIDSHSEEDFHPDYKRIETMLSILRSTPAVIDSFSRQLNSAYWIEHPQPDEWSFTEILCHLRDVDTEVNFPRIQRVLGEENPFLPGIDTDKWAQERLYYCQSGVEALGDFTQSRIQLLDILDSLSISEWERPARHAIFGPTNIKELVSIIVGHDQLHIQQAFNNLGDLARKSISQSTGT
jgi:HAD superfamily hydrolase (TIGR01549 family)